METKLGMLKKADNFEGLNREQRTENGGANSVVVISALVFLKEETCFLFHEALVFVMHCLCHLYSLWFCLWLR